MQLRRANDLEAAGYEQIAAEQKLHAAMGYLIHMGIHAQSAELCLDILAKADAEKCGLRGRRRLLFCLCRTSPPLFDWLCRVSKKRR